MIASDVFRERVTATVGRSFPLLQSRGTGRVVVTDETGLDVHAGGLRARYTWERLELAVQRLAANHTLGVEELGGGSDAVMLVGLLATVLGDDVAVRSSEGLLVSTQRETPPVHQYADLSGPSRRWPHHRRTSRRGGSSSTSAE